MMRLVMLLTGVLLFPSSSLAVNGWHDPLNSMTVIAGFVDGGHIGEDYDANDGDPVFAIADGTVWYYSSNATCYGGGNGDECACVPGEVVFVRHRKADGTYFIAQYGHIKNVPGGLKYSGRDPNGPSVSWGQQIAEIAVFAPCRDCSPRCDHLHLGWWDSEDDIPNSGWGYGQACYANPEGCWVAPSWALAQYAPYGAGPSFAAEYVGQNVNITPWLAGNAAYTLWIEYRNVGTTTWENFGGVTNPEYVELRSVDSGCNLLDSFCAYDAATWTNRQRIESAQQATVPTNSVARFQFVARAASSTGECAQYVAPWYSGDCMNDWAGASVLVRTDATAPSPAPTASVTPTSNTVNSFAFSWTASEDAHSGLRGYYWRVNGSPETFTTTRSVAAGPHATQQGTNTLYVRAEDNVGNSIPVAPVTFTLTSSPCPGREIPHSPCAGSSDCYPSASANLEILPNLASIEWLVGGVAAEGLLSPGLEYSIGFEYSAVAGTDLTMALGGVEATTESARRVLCQAALPPSTGDWRIFWSKPFIVTAEDLKDSPRLRLVADGTDGTEFRNVRILRSE